MLDSKNIPLIADSSIENVDSDFSLAEAKISNLCGNKFACRYKYVMQYLYTADTGMAIKKNKILQQMFAVLKK